MIIKRGFVLWFLVLMVSLMFIPAGSVSAAADMQHGEGSENGMAMHYQHIMLNDALGMVLEGSNLVMLGQMGMAKGIDEVSVKHGKKMMENGRALWNELMSGKVMMKMYGGGMSPDMGPIMKYTHKLAEAQLKVIELLSKMEDASNKGHGMLMHNENTMLNHSLKMALEGSNMVMLGQMRMVQGIDDDSEGQASL